MARGSKKEEAPHVGIPLGPHVEEFLVKPIFDADGVQCTSAIGQDGKEYPDPTPMSPPVGYTPPNDIMGMIELMINRGRDVLQRNEIETEEEANDFDIEDDPLDPLTEYEKVFLPPPRGDMVAPQNAPPAANSPPAALPPAATASSTAAVSPGLGNTSGTVGHTPGNGTSTAAPAPGSPPVG